MYLTEEEIEVLKACFEFIDNGNIGFEAIDEDTGLDSDIFYETVDILRGKL